MEKRYISTTKMATEIGYQTSELFEKLISLGFILPVDNPNKWDLTEKGIAAGGRICQKPNFRDYIEWPADLLLEDDNKLKEDTSKILTSKPYVVQKTADTEGEIYIKDFFREAGIKCEHQVPIRNLSYDSKAHRVADFYIPKYDVYIEFLGKWNTNEEYRNIYREKIKVFKQNHIPCIFLYPENLGYIHFVFDHRMIEVLKENYKENELIRYRKWKFLKGTKDNFWGILLSVVVLLLMYFTKEEGKALLWLLFIYNIYRIATIWNLIYVKGAYSINRMLYD